MSEEDLQTYLRLSDPNNEFMRQIKFGGVSGLKKLYQQ
jgi:hypothetical protein